MGTRASIGVTQFDSGNLVWLYTHWNGASAAKVLQAALKRGESRWEDGPYLARIIFEEMIDGDRKGLTGFGICTGPAPDANVNYLVADTTTQTVKMIPRRNPDAAPVATWPFKVFAEQGCPDFAEVHWPPEERTPKR